ncbi:hypothetical protein BP6252_09146 [Coleophoma cylindrospora]|uniref:Uncharacterized protein n=1 Tax=Coleophoma cylindrospora TaxID=1849047 RepID=A0A3D8R1D4_9HELO|nr:hypothetical protein BP6252_09146 [Coleophoma cylindrospora]
MANTASIHVPLLDFAQRLSFSSSITRQPPSIDNSIGPSDGSVPENGSDKTTANQERPKVALEKNRGPGLWRYLIHLFPLLMTAGILSLSFGNIYWTDIGGKSQNSILNLLQFVAKLHEVLIGASLSSIVLHRVRQGMISSTGIPLGFATSGYQVSSFDYITSKQFWGALMGDHWRLARNLIPTGLLIFIAFMLTTVVGPASAIAMIPKLDWWPTDMPVRVFANTTFDDMWPHYLSGARLDGKNCYNDTEFDKIDTSCPGFGFTYINGYARSYRHFGNLPNITTEMEGNVIRYISSTLPSMLNKSVTSSVAVQPSRVLGFLWEHALATKISITDASRPLIDMSLGERAIRKPVVQVQCSAYYHPNTAIDMNFPHDQLTTSPLDKESDTTWPVPGDLQIPTLAETSEASGHGWNTFRWVNLSSHVNGPSLAGVFTLTTEDSPYEAVVFPCTVDARWAPVDMWLDPWVDLFIRQNTSDPNSTVPHLTAQDQIFMDNGWALALSNDTINSKSENGRPGRQAIPRLVADLGKEISNDHWVLSAGPPEYYPWTLSAILGMYVTDAIARASPNVTTFVYQANSSGEETVSLLRNSKVPFKHPRTSEQAARNPRLTEYTLKASRYGYGWSMEDLTIRFAAAALLLHAVMAMAHICFSLCDQWVCTAWETMGALLVLAINSPSSDKLLGTSVRVGKMRTWKELVRAREGQDGHLQLSLVEQGNRILPEKKYL